MQYGIKKKEAAVPVEDPGLDGRLGRKKKTPEEMEAEANGELPAGATGEGTYYSRRATHTHRIDIYRVARKRGHRLMAIILSNLNFLLEDTGVNLQLNAY